MKKTKQRDRKEITERNEVLAPVGVGAGHTDHRQQAVCHFSSVFVF